MNIKNNRQDIVGSIILEGATTSEDAVIVDGGASKRVIAEGTLQDMDVENRNHRIYAKKDLEPEINGPRMKELIAAKSFKGEMGHPLTNDIVRQQTIDPKLTCVNFLKVWTEGNLVKAQFKGTNNDLGEYFDQDLREGVKPAFSLRALGAIENVNGKAYVRGIKIICYDQVIYPSHPVAYADKIVSESAIESGNSVSASVKMIEEINDIGRIIHLSKSDAQDVLNRLQRESASMDSILNTFEGLSDRIVVTEDNKLRLSTKYGETLYLNLENHIENLIMDYVYGF